jgi:FlaA1/EpsC-like NDP-sugar epimerase
MTMPTHRAYRRGLAPPSDANLTWRLALLVQLVRFRRPVVIFLHLALIGLANYIAFALRFDGAVPPEQVVNFLDMLPWLLMIRAITFVPFRLYHGLWRYTGIWDLVNIIGATLVSTVVFYGVVHGIFGRLTYFRSIFIIDTVVLIVLMGGSRLARRTFREFGRLERRKRILVYGAGDAGEMIVRDMRKNPFYEYEPVGFLDDDPRKVGQRIHGVRVLGGASDLARIVTKAQPEAVLIAMPRVAPARIREIVSALTPYKVPIQTLPNLGDILDSNVHVGHIRDLAVEDLLERAPVELAAGLVSDLVTGRRVMVTGAGGSIGSELCRQISSHKPASLILFERHENGLYTISSELNDIGRAIQPVIGDITDAAHVNAVIAEHAPEIVFHAAAHKHVPLMERTPCEAVKNNVLGTRVVAEAALKHGVSRFVFVSTDKAVNPSSVMGATKRVGELLVQALNDSTDCIFTAVRFGNVLGSNGSVVPRFLEQIRAGGPVTVTHPEVRRYFMLIPEAVHLVLRAAALARGADVFVLEMGEQIKVVDMARNVIRLSGHVPEKEIGIVFIGLRPGEKLSEELVGNDETMESCGVPEIHRVRGRCESGPQQLMAQIARLESLAITGDTRAVLAQLQEIVPTYRPQQGAPHRD